MQQYGIIGYPLGHSFSQAYFSKKFAREGIANARYAEFPLPSITDFPALLLAQPDLHGLNVTIPHKETVIAYLHALDETAKAVGAVNTICIRDGKYTGFNTDVIGLEHSLLGLEDGKWLKKARRETSSALILGTGGGAKAVAFVLSKNGIPFHFVSRSPKAENQISYAELQNMDFRNIRWIFNASPIGSHPNVDNCPDLPYAKLSAAQLVYDLVYNPSETLLLQRAKAQGASVKNGLEMLHLQAEAAWAIWQNKKQV